MLLSFIRRYRARREQERATADREAWRRRKRESGPKRIDYTRAHSGWGHALHIGAWTPDAQGRVGLTGHGYAPSDLPGFPTNIMAGDELLIDMKSGRVAVCVVDWIEYYCDPRDMWQGAIVPHHYLDEEKRDAA